MAHRVTRALTLGRHFLHPLFEHELNTLELPIPISKPVANSRFKHSPVRRGVYSEVCRHPKMMRDLVQPYAWPLVLCIITTWFFWINLWFDASSLSREVRCGMLIMRFCVVCFIATCRNVNNTLHVDKDYNRKQDMQTYRELVNFTDEIIFHGRIWSAIQPFISKITLVKLDTKKRVYKRDQESYFAVREHRRGGIRDYRDVCCPISPAFCTC